ncbi:MAG: protein kinase, partial [Dehalococcoidia bacterium]|nr:protein kinase [Dehalococcoidia bacterium]
MTVTIRSLSSPLREQFRLVRVLGGDDSADDYLAIDRRGGGDVLVRVIRPGALPTADAREGVLGRLVMASGYSAPGVLPLREVGVDAGRVCVVHEWPEGTSLAQRLAAGRQPLRWSAAVIADALQIVLAADAAGVAHPGLTPDNIFVGPSGGVTVSDFGLPVLPSASVLGGDRFGVSLATYVRAPEQVVGCGATPAAQRYAAAATLFWLVAGRPVFEGESTSRVRERHQREAPPDLAAVAPDCPPEFAALIHRALAKAPELRPTDLVESLRAYASDLTPDATSGQRHRRWWVGGAIAAACVAT